jgi:protein-ribulosamine 3-kinase
MGPFNGTLNGALTSINASGIADVHLLSGGCIADASSVTFANGQRCVVKQLKNGDFQKEFNGLQELRRANAIRAPQPLMATSDFIIMEFIESTPQSLGYLEEFGSKMAALHRHSQDSFGFYEDNTIGATHQMNTAHGEISSSWKEFYFTMRLLPQFKLAETNGYDSKELRDAFCALESKLDDILGTVSDPPSLLHGDLWSGNIITDESGSPCIIDPAVYYGHREAEFGMTQLFSGLPSQFYAAYEDVWPMDDGADYRLNVYKLYHAFNHLNLFGKSYYSQTIGLMSFYL